MWDFLHKEFIIYNDHKIDNYFIKKKKKIKEKENLKFLKTKNFFYYDYWFLFFKKKKQKKKEPLPFYLEVILPVTKSKANSLGHAIFSYFEDYYEYMTKEFKLNFSKTKYTDLLTYYSYNAGFNASSDLNLIYFSMEQKLILTLDFRHKKLKTYCMLGDKLVFNVSPGLVIKLLEITEKNLKKSQRVINTIIKTSLKKVIEDYKQNDIVIYIKGAKSYSYKTLSLINMYDFKAFILWNPCVRKNNLRFKKIKAIKKNLLKKHIDFLK